jgi:hypothetical protein
MYSLKKSLIALVGLLVLVGVVAAVMPLVGRGQGQGQAPFAQRTYYLTPTFHNSSQAPTACAAGYHMASLWEIFDTSNLKYNKELGFTQSDSGFGPPTVGVSPPGQPLPVGWIRTGFKSTTVPAAGSANCLAYTTASDAFTGTTVGLPAEWPLTSLTLITPWFAGTHGCDQLRQVWCVQD